MLAQKLCSKLLFGVLAFASLALASAEAQPSLILKAYLSDGVTLTDTVTLVDTGPLDSDPTLGKVLYNGAVGDNWILTITSALTKPAFGTGPEPKIGCFIYAGSNGGGILTVAFSEVY